MTEEGRIIKSQKELNRLHVIHQVIEKAITRDQATVMLGLTDRQVRRIARSVRLEGDAGISHKSRGKSSPNRIADEVKDKTVTRCLDRYKEFGPTHDKRETSDGSRKQKNLEKYIFTISFWIRELLEEIVLRQPNVFPLM